MNPEDHYFIRKANQLARESGAAGFSPFGAILVKEGKIVAESMDGCIEASDPTAHPELKVISEYCRETGRISLEEFTLYSSAEPCIMCSGAIHWARLGRVVFSVSQYQLQVKSGGQPKPSCAALINVGGNKIEILGELLWEEGLRVFEEFPELSKKKLHKNYHAEK